MCLCMFAWTFSTWFENDIIRLEINNTEAIVKMSMYFDVKYFVIYSEA